MNFVFKGFRLTAFNHLLLGTFWEKGQSSERLAIQTPSSVFKHDTKLQRFLAASPLRKKLFGNPFPYTAPFPTWA